MADQDVTRKLVAILSADMVGYSRLMEVDEAMFRQNAKWLLLGLFWLHVLSACATQEAKGAGSDEDASADDVVYINLGESLSITGVVEAGRLIDLRRVETVEGVGDILTFAFEQTDTGMMLTVRSSFDAMVKFRASMKHPVSGDYYRTSTCPVSPGTGTFEFWPHPIAQLRMTDFVLLDPSDARVVRCD